MNRIIVTGGAGFVGSNLCKRLVRDKNNYVICVDNLYTGRLSNIDEMIGLDNFEFVESKAARDAASNSIEPTPYDYQNTPSAPSQSVNVENDPFAEFGESVSIDDNFLE